MLRLLAIIILSGAALATGAWGLQAHKDHKQAQQVPKEEPTHEFQLTTVADVLADQPSDGEGLELENFHFAQEVIGVDLDGQPGWEEAYIPLFPRDSGMQGHSLVSVIYKTNAIKSEEDAEAFFENENLKGFYSESNQELSKVAFGKLARRYGSMDFDRSVLITSDFPKEQTEIPTYLFALAAFGGFLLMAGWQSLGLLGDIRHRITRRKLTENGVGLGSIFGDDEDSNEPPRYERI